MAEEAKGPAKRIKSLAHSLRPPSPPSSPFASSLSSRRVRIPSPLLLSLRGRREEGGEGRSPEEEMAADAAINYPLVAGLLAFTVAQFIKFFTTWYKENRWDARQFIASGGMPSSHSATVTALAVAVGIQEGFRSATFATALIFALVVMHDAFGVRLHAGKQAEVLNQIVYELPVDHPLAETKPLREILGHTVPQVVAGCILGILMAAVMHLALGRS